MIVLSLDLATSVGWAVADSTSYRLTTALEAASALPGKPHYGTKLIKVIPADDLGAFFAKYEAWLLDMLGIHQPELVAFEAPWVGGDTSQNTARKLIGLAVVTEKVCYQRRVPRCFEVNNATVRKHFIGRGSGRRSELKALAIAECERRGWPVKNDDEADALGVLDYAMHCLAPRRAAA